VASALEGGVRVRQITSGARRLIWEAWEATAACPGANVDYPPSTKTQGQNQSEKEQYEARWFRHGGSGGRRAKRV